MRNSITTATQLRIAVQSLAQFEAGVQLNKIHGPTARAEIALYAWKLDDQARGAEYNAAVAQIAGAYGIKPHQSQRAAKGFGFMPLTFSELTQIGRTANVAVVRATAPLKFNTKEAAEKYAERITAPKIEHTASRKDPVANMAKRFAAMTPAMQRDVLAMVKELNAAK